jgi:hypothetical protein
MLEREHMYLNSRTTSMVSSPDAGVTNYYLPVFSSDITEAAPELILWFFDSRGGNHFQELDKSGNEIPYPGYVDDSVRTKFHCVPHQNGRNGHITNTVSLGCFRNSS